jgi:hypothetical protein
LNSRPPVPQTGALTELRYAPMLETKHFEAMSARTNRGLVTDLVTMVTALVERRAAQNHASPAALAGPASPAFGLRQALLY